MLLFDRSQSMLGQAMRDATAAARSFVRSKPASDRIAVVAVGKQAFQLTGFSSGTSEADSALRGLEVDKVRGTALYDAVILSSRAALGSDVHQARVLVLLTDGQEVSSKASLEDAIAAANDAHVTVYPIGIESPSFKPAPLKRLAAETGGRYSGAAGTASLHAIYAALAQELRRTWQLTYFTTARPGDTFELTAAGSAREGVGAWSRSRVRHGVVGAASRSSQSARCSSPRWSAPASSSPRSSSSRRRSEPALRRRLAPHIGEPERKRSRGPVEERFATASSVMRATERAFGNLRRLAQAAQAAGAGGPAAAHGRARVHLPRLGAPGRPDLRRRGCRLDLHAPRAACRRHGPRRLRLVQGAPAVERHRRPAPRSPDHARGIPQGGAQLPGRNSGRRRRGAAARQQGVQPRADRDSARPTDGRRAGRHGRARRARTISRSSSPR